MPIRGWRPLGLFWAVLLVVSGAGAAVLQYLGPMPKLVAERQGPREAAHAPTVEAPAPPAEVRATPAPVRRVAAPDPALMQPSSFFPLVNVPRVGTDGRMARVVYAAPGPAVGAGEKRVALLLAGFGLTQRDSQAALDQLPGEVAFAVSAYADQPALLEAARAGGHELLASVPMEPQGYPMNDEGVRSMRTGLRPEENRKMLEAALGRTPGAMGATGASDGMMGERFADVAAAMDPALDEIGRRGLLYIDPRPGRTPVRPGLPARAVDVVLDELLGRAEIEAKLLVLERIARERGSAIGLAGPLRPVTVERIAAWTKTLGQRGLTLVPVSSLVETR